MPLMPMAHQSSAGQRSIHLNGAMGGEKVTGCVGGSLAGSSDTSSISASVTTSPLLSSNVERIPSDLDGSSQLIDDTVTLYARNNG